MIAKVNTLNCNVKYDAILHLCDLKDKSNLEIVAQIKKIVPEYISNNSIFEKLD